MLHLKLHSLLQTQKLQLQYSSIFALDHNSIEQFRELHEALPQVPVAAKAVIADLTDANLLILLSARGK